MISIAEFCDGHGACEDVRDWALANCDSMLAAWQTLKPDWLLWVATRPGVLTDRELRLFLVFCARQVFDLLTDQRSKDAILVAERFANGEATTAELAAARVAADTAADAAWAAVAAANDGDWAAADVAADAADASTAAAVAVAAWEAASELAIHAAWSTAQTAAWVAGWKPDSRHAQAAWLRASTNPKF